MSNKSFLDKFFKISERGSTVSTEIGAGLATFMTMSYILIVHPMLLEKAGMPVGAVFTVTVLATFIFTFFMGIYAKLPFALAPAMGSNAFFAALVQGGTFTWQQALGLNCVSGIIFLVLSIFGFREIIVKFIPKSLKLGIGAVVGIYLIQLGFKNGGIMAISGNSITLGSVKDPKVITAIIGIFVTAILSARKVKSDMLLGIIASTLVGIPLGVTKIPQSFFKLPEGFSEIAFKVDFSALFDIKVVPIIFVFFVGDFFSTLGTLLGVSEKAGLLDENGDLPDIHKPFIVDATGTVVGTLMGTTTITTFIESAAGVGAGGRTGLTAITTSLLFLATIFLSPIALMVPAAATTSALVVMGVIMLGSFKNVEYDDFTEYFPVFFMVATTAFTNSIANGVAVGILSYVIVKVAAGRAKEIGIGLYILATIMVLYFIK